MTRRGGVLVVVAALTLVRAGCGQDGGMRPAWNANVDALPGFGVVAGEGVVVVAGRDERLHAYDTDGGTALWSYQPPREVLPGYVVAGGRVVLVTKDPDHDRAQVCAVELDTGEQAWCTSVDPAAVFPRHSPVDMPRLAAGDDVVVVYSPDARVRVFDVGSGEVIWETPVDHSQDIEQIRPRSVAVASGAAVVGLPDSLGLVVLDLDSGTERWHSDLDTGPLFEHGFAVSDGVLYAHSGSRGVAAFDLADGTRRWHQDVPAPPGIGGFDLVAGDPVVIGDLLVVAPRVDLGLEEGHVLAGLDRRAGEVVWHEWEPPLVPTRDSHTYRWLAALAEMDGRLVFVGQDVSLLDPATGQVQVTHPLGLKKHAPVAVDGPRLFVVDADGRLLALDVTVDS